MPTLSKIVETCLYVSDLEQTRDFYNGLLGLELITLKKGRHVFFRVGSDVLLCFLPEVTKHEAELGTHYAHGQQHFAFECPAGELDAWKAFLTENGVNIDREITWRPGCRSIYFRDPDQHSVEIVMPGLWE